MVITKKILTFKRLYENEGLEVPVYRLSYKELKELVKECNPLLNMSSVNQADYEFITEYYGVQIEVVTKIVG